MRERAGGRAGGDYLCLTKGLQGTVSGSACEDKQVESVFVREDVCGLLPRGIF